MTIHGLFRRIVRNDAIHIDPPEIYNWRVLALAASVHSTAPSLAQFFLIVSFVGMLRRRTFRSRRWHYWRRSCDARFQAVITVFDNTQYVPPRD